MVWQNVDTGETEQICHTFSSGSRQVRTAIFLVAEDCSHRSFCVSIRDISGKLRRIFFWIKEVCVDDGLAELDKMTEALHSLPSTEQAKASGAAQTSGVYSNSALSFSAHRSCSTTCLHFLSLLMSDAGLVNEKVEKHSRDGEPSLASYIFCGLRWYQDQIEAKKEDIELLPVAREAGSSASPTFNPILLCLAGRLSTIF